MRPFLTSASAGGVAATIPILALRSTGSSQDRTWNCPVRPPGEAGRSPQLLREQLGDLVLEAFVLLVRVGEVVRVGADAELTFRPGKVRRASRRREEERQPYDKPVLHPPDSPFRARDLFAMASIP